jgi:hypothetical protein
MEAALKLPDHIGNSNSASFLHCGSKFKQTLVLINFAKAVKVGRHYFSKGNLLRCNTGKLFKRTFYYSNTLMRSFFIVYYKSA